MIKNREKTEYLEIAQLYASATMTTSNIADRYNLSTRQIQRIAKQHGVLMSNIERNKAISHLKDYSALRKPEHLKKHRATMRPSLRYRLLKQHPYCALCGNRPPKVYLQIDHIDADTRNNNEDNLQVLCTDCNYGKKEDIFNVESV